MAIGPFGAPTLWLGALAIVFVGCEGISSHSLRYFYTGVSEPRPGLPKFTIVAYVNDQLIEQYDSDTREAHPRAHWMKKAEEDKQQYWEAETTYSRRWEEGFRTSLETVGNYYNQSKGFHSLQWMYGCELRQDGSKGRYDQYGYDGKDLLIFDMETFTWTAADPKAQISANKWNVNSALKDYQKQYYENKCIEDLQRFLGYGVEKLLRIEPPVGKVTRKVGYDGMETLICQAYGFYPKEIETTWKKGGEVLEHLTFRRNVAPYLDGTYHAWLSIEIDPEEKEQYECHVDHAGLVEPLVLVWEEPASNLGLIIGCVCIVLVLTMAGAIAGFCFYKKNKKRQEGYKTPAENNLTI